MNRDEAKYQAAKLVGKMKLEEKASQLRYNAPAIDRLGIPAYNWWNEALHGVARAGVATSFPQAIGMAATFDQELLGEIADAIATEGRAKYNAYAEHGDRDIYKGLTFWSPNVNIFRDPRWGRGQETYGEDPYLSGVLGTAFVKGLQGNDEYMKAAACAKHFAVHSGPEAVRHEFDAKVSQKDLYETYLPAFEKLVKDADVEAVMGAYNRTNGEPCCGSRTLIQDILRDGWKFQGHFVSDCWAIKDFHEHHKVTKTPQESAALALNNGCDLNCGSTFLYIMDALKEGLITEETITEACIRLYTTRFMLGLFDETEYDEIPYTVVECPEHLALSKKAAEESIVMLKNDGLLPLDSRSIGTIGVIGPNANSRAALIGNYHGTSSEYVTVLEGIQRLVGDEVRVLYSEGCALNRTKVEHLAFENDRLSEAEIVAENSDVVVLVLGLDELLEGEEGDEGNQYASGDKKDLLLPLPQRDLMETLAATGTPVILCMMAGSDIDMSYAKEHFGAILQAWYPGAQGGLAVADILFGKCSPSGKLCVTFYDGTDSLPEFEDYSMKGRTYRYLDQTPQYPFGYGLTYGKVAVTEAILRKGQEACERTADEVTSQKSNAMELVETYGKAFACIVEATVKNEGDTDTGDVVQVYVAHPDTADATPHPRLCGFQRVFVKAGEEKKVRISLDTDTYMVINDKGEKVEGGKHHILYVGCSQPDERSVSLTGVKPVEIEVRFGLTK